VLPAETLAAFDRFLANEGLSCEATVIGGSALVLMGVISRATRDCDVLDPVLPADIQSSARRFAQAERAAGRPLGDDWLNNGPRSLVEVLPDGWRERTITLQEGISLRLRTLGRGDLLRTKLFALCDRGTDMEDCVALAPTEDELAEAAPWVAERDAHPGWPGHVGDVLAELGRRMGHGV